MHVVQKSYMGVLILACVAESNGMQNGSTEK